MSPSLLIASITTFILSLVLALVFAMSAPKINDKFLKFGATVHFTLLSIALFTMLFFSETNLHHYMVLFSCCTGLMLSGYVLREKATPWLLKYYLASYLFLLGLFFYSPSHLMYFISGNLKNCESAQEFQLKENYYLVEQQSMLQLTSKTYTYKVIQKFGIYNRTIARDLSFTDRLTKVDLIQLNEDTLIINGTIPNNKNIIIGLHPGMNSNTIIQKRK